METRLTEARANIIANAIRNDGTFCGSPDWLDSHHITVDEFDAFLAIPAQYLRAQDYRSLHPEVGSVEVPMTFTTHSGKVGQSDEKWTVMIPQKYTNQVLMVAEHGDVSATLVPEVMMVQAGQLSLDIEGAMVDPSTGEVFE